MHGDRSFFHEIYKMSTPPPEKTGLKMLTQIFSDPLKPMKSASDSTVKKYHKHLLLILKRILIFYFLFIYSFILSPSISGPVNSVG